MPRTNYQRGADKERRILHYLKSYGFICARSAGSHSPVDVWAINPETKVLKLIQAKLGGISKRKKEELIKENERLNGIYKVTYEIWD